MHLDNEIYLLSWSWTTKILSVALTNSRFITRLGWIMPFIIMCMTRYDKTGNKTSSGQIEIHCWKEKIPSFHLTPKQGVEFHAVPLNCHMFTMALLGALRAGELCPGQDASFLVSCYFILVIILCNRVSVEHGAESLYISFQPPDPSTWINTFKKKKKKKEQIWRESQSCSHNIQISLS